MSTITIEVMQQREVYELLCILDFDNVRKRMSVSYLVTNHLAMINNCSVAIVCFCTFCNTVVESYVWNRLASA